MGLYNHRKLSNLRKLVETVAARQHRLLQITAVTLIRLDDLKYMMAETMKLISEDINITLTQQ
jgi:hypothetical protein